MKHIPVPIKEYLIRRITKLKAYTHKMTKVNMKDTAVMQRETINKVDGERRFNLLTVTCTAQ